jgi:hypothetical protein
MSEQGQSGFVREPVEGGSRVALSVTDLESLPAEVRNAVNALQAAMGSHAAGSGVKAQAIKSCSDGKCQPHTIQTCAVFSECHIVE